MLFILSNHARVRVQHRGIKEEWIEATINSPQKTETDPEDPDALRAWKRIPEKSSVLRVVYNHTNKPYKIITVFFDRSMKNKL